MAPKPRGVEAVDSPGCDVLERMVLRQMVQLRIGERVVIRARTLLVRSLSPMGARPRRVQLEDADTGEQVEVPLSDLQPAADEVDEGGTQDQAR